MFMYVYRDFEDVVFEDVVVYTSRFVRVILAQGPC